MPINSNGSSLEVFTNYNGEMEKHREDAKQEYQRNQQTEPPITGVKQKIIVVDKEGKTKVTYSTADEKLLEAAENDARNRGLKKQAKAKTTRKPRAKRTTKPKTEKE